MISRVSGQGLYIQYVTRKSSNNVNKPDNFVRYVILKGNKIGRYSASTITITIEYSQSLCF